MRTHEGNSPRDQAGSDGARIDLARLKALVNPQALEIIGKRMEIVGNPSAREVRIMNTHRGEKTSSASWNPAKGLFCDKGDASYDGDILHFVQRCDGVSFAEAARIAADEAGVDIPYLDGKAQRPASNGRSEGNNRSHHTPGARPEAQDRTSATAGNEESPEQRIKSAQKEWEKGGPVLDTPGEDYLNTRKITLDREEPSLRYDQSHPHYVRIEKEGCVPTYQLVGRYPTLMGAATIAGKGEVRAVAKIAFECLDDGTVNTKPVIVDPRTGEPFKKNKRLRGVMEGAGIFLGQHLAGDTIVITEGVEDALCAVTAGVPAVAKMGAQTLENLTLAAQSKRVILAGDNDEAGRAGVKKAAKAYRERGLDVRIAELPEGIKDLNDVLIARGIETVRQILAEARAWEPASERAESEPAGDNTTDRAQQPGRLLEFVDDVQLSLKTDYLIKHLLVRGDLGVIYGPPGSGKSFVALYLAACIALGLLFAGHRTRVSPVLYVGLEGEAGMRRRMAGLRKEMGAFGKRLARMCRPILLSQDEGGEAGQKLLIDAIGNLRESSGQDVGLVIIDTVWRAMAGDDENSAKEMGKFIARLKAIQDQTGVAVLLVHHSGKDADRGMRGSSSLLGAVDVVMKVDAAKTITVEKNKDGPDGDKIGFALRRMDLGIDDEGDPISTCVVDILDTGSAKGTRQRPKPETAAGKALQQLEELIIEKECERVVGYSGIPDHADVVKLEVWRNRCKRKGLCPGSHPDNRDDSESKAFRRAQTWLEASGWIGITDNKVWIVRERSSARTGRFRPSNGSDGQDEAEAA